ncbi:hypothetical protein R6Z07F_013558 [Ovis aries]
MAGAAWLQVALGSVLTLSVEWGRSYRQGLAPLLDILVGLVLPLPDPGNPIRFLLPGPLRKPEKLKSPLTKLAAVSRGGPD